MGNVVGRGYLDIFAAAERTRLQFTHTILPLQSMTRQSKPFRHLLSRTELSTPPLPFLPSGSKPSEYSANLSCDAHAVHNIQNGPSLSCHSTPAQFPLSQNPPFLPLRANPSPLCVVSPLPSCHRLAVPIQNVPSASRPFRPVLSSACHYMPCPCVTRLPIRSYAITSRYGAIHDYPADQCHFTPIHSSGAGPYLSCRSGPCQSNHRRCAPSNTLPLLGMPLLPFPATTTQT